jgi:peptide/nickel transport system substrate-binding protein
VTCQILPPNLPGYKPYCPFTINPGAGKWTAPDIARARRLLDASGVRGARVVVWDAPIFNGTGKYITSLLNDLGFKAELKVVNNIARYFNTVNDSRSRTQIFGNAWYADYPGPSNFLYPLFSCRSFIPGSPINLNSSGFCNPNIDRVMSRAFRLEAEDRIAANRLWARIDKQIVDLSPWAAILNPIGADFVSERLGNYQYNPQWGALLSQLWID